MTRGVVMAGGRSSRMRASRGEGRHKGLVPVLGVPLLERNVSALLSAGIRDVVLVVAEDEEELLEFGRTRCRALVEAWGERWTCFVERQPLGTIGAAREVGGPGDLLVVNVDNLTALDLAGFVAHHRATGAAMTVATHWESFTMPFGEVTLTADGMIDAIAEKPVKRYHTSSGTYVLSAEACAAIPPGRPLGAPSLWEILHAAGKPVAAFEHESAWIDVNDAAALERAERLVLGRADEFELWSGAPDREVSAVVAVSGDGAAWLARGENGGARYPGMWELVEHAPGPDARPLIRFDDPHPQTRTRVRYRVYAAPEDALPPRGGWVPVADPALSPPARRALEALRVSRAVSA
jgi:NDP-sugar pyrophosphorylase family protein